MPLASIIGQDRTIALLRGILRRNIAAHCYLFSGEGGIGKTQAAHEFAKALLCREIPDDACGVCANCERIDAGIHPDVRTIGGEERQIKIDEIRAIDESLGKKAFEGGRKVVVVRQADTMNSAAANAFLKTLEEPPPESVIILVSSRPELLPDTIRSRAQNVRFYPVPRGEIVRMLEPEFRGEADIRSRLASGRASLAVDPELLKRRDEFLDGLRRAVRGEAEADQIWGGREEIDLWMDQAIAWLRDIVAWQASGSSALLVNADREREIQAAASRSNIKAVSSLLSEIYRVKELLRFNLNKQITFQYILMRLAPVLR
ncbi:MAG: DNA polymerase III subunit delta' [Nitrospirae bacterium]|nr:DNA polymerase III subunit delta' [Nitrospirota bacterium]